MIAVIPNNPAKNNALEILESTGKYKEWGGGLSCIQDIGQLILIYVSSNIQEYRYLCEVTNIDKNNETFDIKLIKRFSVETSKLLSREKLEKHGLPSKGVIRYYLDGYPNLYNYVSNILFEKENIKLPVLQAEENLMIDNDFLEKLKNILKNNYQIILQGPPGTGKTRLAKIIAVNLVSGQNILCLDDNNEKIKKEFEKLKDQIKIIQFHPSYSYEDFVRGIVAKPRAMNILYKTENKILAKMAEEALKNPGKNYVLIIDEINRANLSSVLGELIYALEYRGEEVESMYELNGSRKIILPKNLYIIGTMNTADRSVGHIDYAIRRRFTFINILPDKSIITDSDAKQLFEEVEKIFDDYLSPEFDKNDVMIGHSYFLDNNLENALEYKIKPLLLEYVKDGVLKDDAKKEIEKLKV